MTEPMLPVGYRVIDRTIETRDSATLCLEPVDQPLAPFRPGQFAMMYAYGVGEVPISISGIGDDGTLTHTIRSVGAVSRALHDAQPGTVIGVRGPFGTTWAPEGAAGNDLVVVAGGVGLAPLRPVVLAALGARSTYRKVVVIAGARTPDEFLFRAELDAWTARDDLDVELTVDQPAAGWDGAVGFVTEPLARLRLDPGRTVAFLCGPEPMMRFSARVLLRAHVPADRIHVSLERSMKCGIALCGHCQLGPLLVCRDGPVVPYTVAEPLLAVPEL
ncbi:NAD(P)H-flavin reductase [Kribbella sp. VKM Ac-2571]|uniref:FAD/NAD(P)-binding protein n=1 Tax=Kribbella sp. VKM Ac-2571 TaxID=2512222 RepID=UPI0010E2E3A9|nr:FAD/NAD(P)-binding protein [Kribbella sp. VKM Ac-2571]TDO58750.1 NAD(P)H-flavin reductase [Kribbella sp. VKM Ac-2571]